MTYIISQTIGLIAFTISLFAYHRKTKKGIFYNMLFVHFFNVIHYLLLGAYNGCITKIIAILRDSFIILKENNKNLNKKIFLYMFVGIYILSAFLLYKNILSLFPILSATIYLIFIWNGNELTIKKAGFYCCFLWLIYNIYVFSISGIISNILLITSDFIAIKNYKKRTKNNTPKNH